jgi:ribosome-binding factor A
MAQQRRVFRVAEKIRELVAGELNRMADPRFSLVTITKVMVSPDLRHAKVYWVVTGKDERRAEVQEAFTHAEGLFKRILAKDLGTRFVPALRFYYDDTLDTCDEVERLFAKISHPDNDQEGPK